MCKYCRMIPTDVIEGEAIALRSIGKVKDGRNVVELFLYRYYDGDSDRCNALNIEFGLTANEKTIHSVKEKNIAIKYCPFCGEKF